MDDEAVRSAAAPRFSLLDEIVRDGQPHVSDPRSERLRPPPAPPPAALPERRLPKARTVLQLERPAVVGAARRAP
jgi:hypothetical protein